MPFCRKICFIPLRVIEQTKGETNILTHDSKGHDAMSQLKELIEKSLDDDKAFDIQTIDIKGQSSIADYIIIASGTSTTQVKGIANKLKDRLNARGYKNIRIEGAAQGDWVVVDAGDAVIHLFRPEVREFYNIEKMWSGGFTPAASDTNTEGAHV